MHHYSVGFFAAILLAASCAASPVKRSSITCAPLGDPSKLIAYPHKQNLVYYVESSSKSNQYELLATNTTDEQFQFYDCSLPSDKYRKPTASRKYGQVHSLKHPGMCITPDNNLVPLPSNSDDGYVNFGIVPKNTSGIINLAPCETSDSEVLRRQWLLLDYPQSNEQCKLPELKQAGRKGDLIAKDLFVWRGRVEFDYLSNTPPSPAYLHDHLPKACKI